MQNLRWLGVRVRAPRFVVTSLARTSSVSANISNALEEEDFLNSVVWIGIVLISDQDPNFHMSMLIRIRIGIKMMSNLMRILPQVSHMLENPNFLYYF